MGKTKYENLKTGDVVLTTGRSPIAGIIKFVSKSKATHVGIVIDLYGKKIIAEMLNGGLTLSTFNCYKRARSRNVLEVLRAVDLADSHRKIIRDTVLGDFVKKLDYDWHGLFSFLLPKVQHRSDKYFCSEYVAKLLDIHLNSFVQPYETVTPGDLSSGNKNFYHIPVIWEAKNANKSTPS